MPGRTLSSIEMPFSRVRARSNPIFGALLLGIFLCLAGLIAGCSIQLSPAFDKATYDSLADLNTQTETLFASLSAGASASGFAAHKPVYDTIIGGFSAARMVTATRQVPPLSERLLATAPFKAACSDDPTRCVNPTPHHLEKIITLLTAMRDAHQRGPLPAELVGGFKRQYEIEMTSVLVFEAALQR